MSAAVAATRYPPLSLRGVSYKRTFSHFVRADASFIESRQQVKSRAIRDMYYQSKQKFTMDHFVPLKAFYGPCCLCSAVPSTSTALTASRWWQTQSHHGKYGANFAFPAREEFFASILEKFIDCCSLLCRCGLHMLDCFLQVLGLSGSLVRSFGAISDF